MPELPEVETIVRGLKSKVLERTFDDAWTDFPKMIKKPKTLGQFKKEIKSKKIKEIWRRGKNIIFDLSDDTRPEFAEGLSLLIHQKLTGHLLVGKWQLEKGKWIPQKGPLSEKINTFIHLLFKLDDGRMIALSDVRKFAKVELWKSKDLLESKEFKNLGPEPLEKSFTFEKFKKLFENKKGRIKQVLMDQNVIAGIGNIYSDEILWRARIHPLKAVSKLSEKELKAIYDAMKEILKKAIDLGGESFSDFRNIEGRRGEFDKERKVYRRQGEKCRRCGAIIKRIKIGGRSAHFCPCCQIL